jgi:hypothetical protein
VAATRIASFGEFWPYYLGEHRNPRCRALHFVGTTGFFLALASGVAAEPGRFGPVLAGVVALGAIGTFVERRFNAALLLLGMVALAAWGSPIHVLAGVVWAYAFAWIGHFVIEHNRPATFTYPVWSLLGDFRMWGAMATGRLWRGDSLATGADVRDDGEPPAP